MKKLCDFLEAKGRLGVWRKKRELPFRGGPLILGERTGEVIKGIKGKKVKFSFKDFVRKKGYFRGK